MILLKDFNSNSFSYLKFYERRTRRLLPVLFFVMIATVPFAYILMFPQALKSYSGSMLSSIFFTSNIWFWLEDSYWAGLSNLKPFIHTWSLSIEEQFYILYPFTLILLYRFARKHIFSCMLLIFVVSLAYSQVAASMYQEANFYLIFSRSWELLLGGLLAKREMDKGRTSDNIFNQVAPGIGVLLIIFSVFYFDIHTPHPSLITLIPTIGTALVIWFGGRGDKFSYLLSTKPLVGVGLLSYSLYLWHQPVFAFARILDIADSTLLKVCWIIVSIVLSTISYIFIEKYFRSAKTASLKKFGLFTGSLFIILIICSSLIFVKSNNYMDENTGNSSVSKYKSACDEIKKNINIGCRAIGSGDKVTVIWGDSHAGTLTSSEPKLSEDEAMIYLTHPGCPPLVDVYMDRSYKDYCSDPDRGSKIIKFINTIKPRNLIIMARWDAFYEPRLIAKYSTDIKVKNDNEDMSKVALLKKQLKKTLLMIPSKTFVVLISQGPDLSFIPKTELVGKEKVNREDIESVLLPENELFDGADKLGNLYFIKLLDVFCDNENCNLQDEKGNSYYKDENHMNKFGSQLVWDAIKKKIRNLSSQ